MDFDSSSILVFLYKWRKPILIVVAIAIVASVIFSSPWFITPKYKSTVIMFPVATNSVSKVLIAQNSGVKEDILGFGEEEQAEQLLQILNSNLIRDRIIEKYNLMEHYDIKHDAKFKYTRLYREYESNVKFRRTEYLAVKVSVLDKDPQMAADIANDIAALVDSTKNAMQKERAMKAFEIVEAEYKKLQSEVETIVDSLRTLGKMGINDYERQSEVLNQQLAIAIRNNDPRGQRMLQEKLDILGEYGGTFLSLKNSLEFKTEQLTLLKSKYQEAKMDAEQELPQKFVVNSAYKAEKKSYPIRSLIVIVTVFSALFLTILVILIFENLSKFNVNEIKKKLKD
jgi:capsular polysaccharide biosynthesis protein